MSESKSPKSFGRVENDGTVYVQTVKGERKVGQVPEVAPDEALEFFIRRFKNLETEVQVLISRVNTGTPSPEEAKKTIASLRENISTANAVGDLDGLIASLDALSPVIEAQTEARRLARKQRNEEAKLAKEEMVAEAEKLAGSSDWRHGADRFAQLLEKWKTLPRIDRKIDDELWHRFSSARTSYTHRRKAQFAQQAQERQAAQQIKQQIIEQAKNIADSTDWGATSAEFRNLLSRWKAAGPAPRSIENNLWEEFRDLQNKFFNAREQANNQATQEQNDNLAAKEKLLDEAESTILPVTDLAVSQKAYREFLRNFNQYGHVPRDAIKRVDARLHAIESELRNAEEEEWRRTDPEARRRAEETAQMFEGQITKLKEKLAKAEAKKDKRSISEISDSIKTYESWLLQTQQTLSEFKA